jgi:hypothetical protein
MMTPLDATKGYATQSEKPLGMVIPSGNFGALPAQVTGSEWPDSPLWSAGYAGTNWENGKFDIGLPSVSRTGKITFIDKKTNPILIYLDDKTRLEVPNDLIRGLTIKPEYGKTVMVTFQRRKDDGSINYSRIQSFKVF